MTNAGSVLLIAIPLGIAFISLMLKKAAKLFLILGTLLNVGLLFSVKMGDYFLGGYKPPYGIVLHVDSYAFYSLIVLNILFALLIIVVIDKAKKLSPILLIALAALNGLILTGDLFNLFVFMEIASIAAIIITSSNKKLIHSFNYMVIAIVGSSLYLLGLAFLYSQYGTLNMARMHELMAAGDASKAVIPIILIFVGLAVETKLLPFNGWVKGIIENSDELTGPMIGSIYSGVMLIVFGRLFSDIFILNSRLTMLLSIIAVVTLIAGEIAAFDSKKIRQVLLYSSTAQSGLAILLILNGYINVSIFVIFGNVVAKFVLYLLTGLMSSGLGTDGIAELNGIFTKKLYNGIAFTIAALSVVGLPLFFGFIVKVNVLYTLFIKGSYVLPGLILLASLIEAAYMIRMLVALWNPGKDEGTDGQKAITSKDYTVKRVATVSALVLSLILVVLGIAPKYVINLAHQTGDTGNANQSGYSFILKEGDK